MEALYSWLFVLSGASITLLGALLFVSERELGNKRREFDASKRNQTAKPKPSPESQHSEIHSSPELIPHNEDLLKEISALSSRLEETQRALDERQNDHRRLASAQFENQQLRETIESVTDRLETSERQLRESNSRLQEAAGLNATLDNEIAILKQQLAERDTAINTLHSAAQGAAELRSETHELRVKNQHLQEQTARLENRLRTSEDRLNVTAGQHQAIAEQHGQLQARLAESRQQIEDLTAKNRDLRGEVERLSSELAASEKNVAELRTIQQNARLDNQQLIEANQQLQLRLENQRLQEEAESGQIQLDASEARSQQTAGRNQESHNRLRREESIADFRQQLVNSQSNAQESDTAQLEPERSWAIWTSVKRNWRLGAISATVIVIAGAVAMGFLESPFSTPKELAIEPEITSDEYTADEVAKPEGKPAPRLRGTFETVRPTQVYRGPSENSGVIGSIGRGTKLNVVDSTDGWLEIRSKHGRPPGFVRQEATVKIGRN